VGREETCCSAIDDIEGVTSKCLACDAEHESGFLARPADKCSSAQAVFMGVGKHGREQVHTHAQHSASILLHSWTVASAGGRAAFCGHSPSCWHPCES